MLRNPLLPELYENEAKKIERQIIDRRVQLAIEKEGSKNSKRL